MINSNEYATQTEENLKRNKNFVKNLQILFTLTTFHLGGKSRYCKQKSPNFHFMF